MWKEAWCVADRRDVTGECGVPPSNNPLPSLHAKAARFAHLSIPLLASDDTPGGAFLIRWAPTAKLFYHHSRLLLNSLVLQATEEHEEFVSPVYVDCWSCAISLIGIMLEDFGEKNLVYVTNGTVVMAVYAAIFALRLTKLDHVKFPFVDRDAIINLVRHLAEVLSRAGRTPTHRNGAAGPYGNYLRSVLSLWESPLSTPEEDVTPSDDRRDSHGREGEVVRKAVSGAATPSGAVGTNSSGSGGGAIAHAILTPANFQSPGTSTGDSGSTPSSTMLQQQQMNTANVPLLGQVSDNVGTDVWGATTSINADSVLSGQYPNGEAWARRFFLNFTISS